MEMLYLAGVANKLNIFLTLIILFSLTSAVVLYADNQVKNSKYLKNLIIVALVLTITVVLIPSKETIIAYQTNQCEGK